MIVSHEDRKVAQFVANKPVITCKRIKWLSIIFIIK